MPKSLAGKRMNGELNPGSEARSSTVHRSESHLVLLLALVAMLALFQIRWVSFLHPGRWILITDLLIMLSLTCGMFLFLPSGFGGGRFASRILLGGLLAFPVVTHFLMRFRGWGEASEILMLQLCQNVAIYLVVWPGKSPERFNQLSVLFSFFLVFFATALAETLAVYLVTLSYLVVGVWWLLSRHWRRLQVHMPASVETNFRIRSGSFVMVLGVLLPVALLVGWNHQKVVQTLSGIMPTSGGSRFSDPFSRSGVGAGDFFVAARNHATTVGPVESDLFLESTRPSLFDIQQDQYDRPLLPNRKSERAFSPDDVKMQHAHQKIIQSEQAGRTFRTLRGLPDSMQAVDEKKSNALFYLEGPVPIRLALRYFDQFDGLDWSVSQKVAATRRRKLVGSEVNGKFWVRRGGTKLPVSRDQQGSAPPRHPFFEGYEYHSVRVMRLATDRVLASSSLAGWHFDKCEDCGFFGWTPDGAIRFRGRDSIPELATYHLISRGVNYGNLDSREMSLVRQSSPYCQTADLNEMKTVSRQAVELTRECQTDWAKVKVILQFLRDEFLHDPDSPVCLTERDLSPIQRFLETRSGPDYLFATTAALMLRSQGIETRLVNGFYVGPQDYDAYSGQSIVKPCHLHFWLEVRVNGMDWVTVEPTPGYEPPRSKVTLWQRLESWGLSAAGWISGHPLEVCTGLLLVLALWIFRKQLVVCGWLLCWWIGGIGSTRRRILATLTLLGKLKKRCPFKGKETVAALCQHLLESGHGWGEEAGFKEELKRFSHAANRVLYRSDSGSRPDAACRSGELQACQRIAAAVARCHWTFYGRTRMKIADQKRSKKV